MKTWLVPVLLIFAAALGGFLIWWSEGMPVQQTISYRPSPSVAPVYQYHPPVVFPRAATATPVQPLPQQPSCTGDPSMLQMKAITPEVFADLEGDSANGNVTGTYNMCLWWGDNLTYPGKTYELYRGLGGFDLPLSSMKEIASFSASTSAYEDIAPRGQVCYIILILDGEGSTYQTEDTCFSNNF